MFPIALLIVFSEVVGWFRHRIWKLLAQIAYREARYQPSPPIPHPLSLPLPGLSRVVELVCSPFCRGKKTKSRFSLILLLYLFDCIVNHGKIRLLSPGKAGCDRVR